MSTLNDYVEKMKQETIELDELEKARYVYIDLGKRFSFDMNFALANNKKQIIIYHKDRTKQIEENLCNFNGICKDIALIYAEVLNRIGLDAKIINIEKGSIPNCEHVCNIVKLRDGSQFICDLQSDLENIQSRSRTYCFGILAGNGDCLSKKALEQIDRKIGYIDKDNYYADDYRFLLEQHLSMFEDFLEKIDFLLKNIEPYDNKMKYAERRWRHERLLRRFLTKHEQNKIKIIDSYYNKNDNKNEQSYVLGIAVNNEKGTRMYLFSEENLKYEEVDMLDICKMIKEKQITPMQKIPKLRHYMNIYKEKEEEENKKLNSQKEEEFDINV